MNQYVVTISPVTENDPTAVSPHMIVRIDVSGGAAHVVELTVRASAGADLATGQLPSIDLERLAQVFGSPTAPGAAAVEAASGAAPAGDDIPDAEPVAAPHEAPAPVPRAVRRASARPSGPSGRSGTAIEQRRNDERNVTAARAYRRMPDPDELKDLYTEIGSIAGVAKHYGVPTHTAQGWIGRLRRLGVTTS